MKRADGSSAPRWRGSPDGRRASRASRAPPFPLPTCVAKEKHDVREEFPLKSGGVSIQRSDVTHLLRFGCPST